MTLVFEPAGPEDARALSDLQKAVSEDLTRRYGDGHWSTYPSESEMRDKLDAEEMTAGKIDGRVVATFTLRSAQPWAGIDIGFFTPAEPAIYLLDMAVMPELQRNGIGRGCIDEAVRLAATRSARSIRLDAYAADAGAADFYLKCGFREVGRADYFYVPLVFLELLTG